MKKTTLYHHHLELNAKMSPFGGYEMPIQYTGVKKEHLAVRNNLGVFDVSHMGEFYVTGANALPLLQYLCSNDISKITVGIPSSTPPSRKLASRVKHPARNPRLRLPQSPRKIEAGRLL